MMRWRICDPATKLISLTIPTAHATHARSYIDRSLGIARCPGFGRGLVVGVISEGRRAWL